MTDIFSLPDSEPYLANNFFQTFFKHYYLVFLRQPITMSYNSGKRSRDEFEEHSGGFGSGGNDQFDSKKQHIDPATELILNVCKDIRRIGENNNILNQVDDISYISNPIVAEFEQIDNLRTSILNTLHAVIIEQPQKINSLSVLILICNAKNFLVSKYVVEFFHAKLQSLLDDVKNQQVKTELEDVDMEEAEPKKPEVKKSPREHEFAGIFNNIKSILKFLATLSPIINDYSIINVFKQFLNLSIELQNASDSSRIGVAEEIYFNVLIAVPYLLSNDFSEEMIGHVNELIELAKTFNLPNNEQISILEPFDSKLSNFIDELPYKLKKMVNLILASLIKLQGENKDWVEFKDKLFINFKELVDPIIKSSLENNSISNESVKHPLPQLALPSIELLKGYKPTGLIDNLWYKHSRLLFQVYNITTDFETVPSIESYYGLFFEDLSFDILTNLSFNQKEASIQLSILDLFFSKNLFTPPGSSIDQLGQIHQDNESGENNPPLSTWKIEDVAVQSILTMIFQLPTPLHYEIYYYTVLISCCRESPESIAPVFGRAIRYFYNNLETLDYELKIRFLDWMTIQISNFEFSWKWDEWVNDSVKLRNLKYHPKKNFIKNLIAKEVRLSNKNRIKDSFVTIKPSPDGEENTLVNLDEFYKYLNISLFPNESEYVLNYDYDLYGASNEEFKESLEKLIEERKESINPLSISPQEELIYNFSNPQFPLNEISSKVYDFSVNNWKPNEDFKALYDEILEGASQVENIIPEKFLINLIFQTYAYIGSRSIYSIVSILSRDVNKLKFVSGIPIKETDYQIPNEYKFENVELSEEAFDQRQTWIIQSIFRIWIHQPQVAFLILEYLIEFEILKPKYLIEESLSLESNLIIDNVSCMESINRIIINDTKSDESQTLLLSLFKLIVKNLNQIATQLQVEDSNEEIKITKDFEDADIEDLELMGKIDSQWLFYEYRGLLKSYLRKFSDVVVTNLLSQVKDIVGEISNTPVKNDALKWIEDLQA